MKQNMAVLLKTKINIAMVAAVILAILCWSYSTFRGYCLLYELHLVEQMDIWNYLLYNLNSAYSVFVRILHHFVVQKIRDFCGV